MVQALLTQPGSPALPARLCSSALSCILHRARSWGAYLLGNLFEGELSTGDQSMEKCKEVASNWSWAGGPCSPTVARAAAGEAWLVAQAGKDAGQHLVRSCFTCGSLFLGELCSSYPELSGD